MPYSNSFKKLLKNMNKQYLGEEVPKERIKQYGTMYNKKDVLSFATATAKSRGIQIDKPKEKGAYFLR